MFGMEDQQQNEDPWANWVGRVETAQYNLAVQRHDPVSATGTLARMFGQWLANRFAR